MLKLKSYMVLFDDTIGSLAKHLGVSRQTLSGRINGHTQFKSDEIVSIAERYNLGSEDIVEIFF